ncbi:hypothetical protein BP00DRAFT_234759 [Aspergillus indologenus CBS 114.80]|uniref:Uncharacterized protein n=1 Tax=Aspergillus indologenus CBS 114.80 TaxID=1450541 RepID=A0A2V5JGE3_9EURO|nr:hypothetical protein BP00DRAFT_234759 [Aspergillus indologenus CBS 114.80]
MYHAPFLISDSCFQCISQFVSQRVSPSVILTPASPPSSSLSPPYSPPHDPLTRCRGSLTSHSCASGRAVVHVRPQFSLPVLQKPTGGFWASSYSDDRFWSRWGMATEPGMLPKKLSLSWSSARCHVLFFQAAAHVVQRTCEEDSFPNVWQDVGDDAYGLGFSLVSQTGDPETSLTD